MILCIDAGNTNISFAIFQKLKINFKLISKFDLQTEKKTTSFELLSKIIPIMNFFNISIQKISEVKIATVVPELERIFFELFSSILKVKKVRIIKNTEIPLKINLHNKNEVGIDRIINIYSALKIYGNKKNILVIDFGTAITFDVGTKEGTYEGGIIFPGINLSLEALKNGTSKLPKVSFENVNSPVGKSTAEAINAGIFYGYSEMVNGVVLQIKKCYKEDFNIILTGGLSSIISKNFNFKHTTEETLNLKGILIS